MEVANGGDAKRQGVDAVSANFLFSPGYLSKSSLTAVSNAAVNQKNLKRARKVKIE